jgi:chromatin segregation and condensation protein Rec8/ScpA/Scc1 (kleisin family)
VHRSFVRVAPPPVDWLPTGLENVTLQKLLGALARAINRLPPAPPPERLQRALLNIAELRVSVLSTIRRRGRLSFAGLIAGCRSRLEAIITFLVVLDLLKTEELGAEQSSTFGDIVLQPAGRPAEAASTA